MAAEPPVPVLAGVCEASSAVRSGEVVLVADNEVDDALYAFDPSSLTTRERAALGAPIEDVEALVPTSTGAWVIGSQGRNQKGKAQPERARIGFWPGSVVVQPDLSGCAPCAAAEPKAPEAGGVNVEGGLVAADHLWLGLRSPLVDGKALLVELDEPAQSPTVATPRVLRTVLLDLGGRGVREIAPAQAGGWWVVAGPADGADAPHALYRLAGPEGPAVATGVVLPPGAEALVDEGPTLLWLTDGKGKDGVCETPSTWGRIPTPR